MVLRKNVAFFDWEWGINSAPRDGQKIPSFQDDHDTFFSTFLLLFFFNNKKKQL